MKWLLIVLLCSVSAGAFAGKDGRGALITAMHQLDSALLHNDTAGLKQVLHPAVSYGHSNGWIQTRQEVIGDLFNGKLTYLQMQVTDTPVIRIEGRTAIVRYEMQVRVVVDGKELAMKLKVLQAWVREHHQWHLLGRQSVKAG